MRTTLNDSSSKNVPPQKMRLKTCNIFNCECLLSNLLECPPQKLPAPPPSSRKTPWNGMGGGGVKFRGTSLKLIEKKKLSNTGIFFFRKKIKKLGKKKFKKKKKKQQHFALFSFFWLYVNKKATSIAPTLESGKHLMETF